MTAPEATPPQKNNRIALILVAVVAIPLAVWGGSRYWHGLAHVSTDNAQIAGHIVPIQPKVGGFIAGIAVEPNQKVTAGTLLMALDDRDYRVRLAQAEAELQTALAAAGKEGGSGGQAGAQVAVARANAAAARSHIDQAIANADKAQRDLERTRQLIEKKMISPQALDAAEAAARTAQAQVRAAKDTAASAGEQISASSAALRAALAKVEVARAARDLAAIQLADTRITAPIDGVVGARNVVPGQLVQPNQPLFNMVSDKVWVVANLKETDVARIKPGQAVEFEVDAYPGHRFQGSVESLSPASGAVFSLLPPDNATGNFTKVVQRIPVRITVTGDDLEHPLRPGMSAVVTIATR